VVDKLLVEAEILHLRKEYISIFRCYIVSRKVNYGVVFIVINFVKDYCSFNSIHEYLLLGRNQFSIYIALCLTLKYDSIFVDINDYVDVL
jgi:hypothetical protein